MELNFENQASNLSELKEEVQQCTRCRLAHTREHVVFGEGNPEASLFLIGEAPGRNEDEQGRPFVGRSGQLLDKILSVCGFTRKDHAFITSIVKCRPPDNRMPTTEELSCCKPCLLRQIELIKPEMLIFLGATALKNMLGPSMKITRVRGQWLQWEDLPAMAVYHPAALLRTPSLKKDTWEDFKRIVGKYRELVDPEHYSEYV